jgi:L-rhamnose-H+ transport protein
MALAILMGLAAVVLAGVLQGLFAVPMKYAPRWNYEHIWLSFSLAGMVVLPWMLTAATVPHTAEVYSLTPTPALLRIVGFGLCWGIGSALAGLGMNLLGIGLGMAIILGLSASLGSLIPLLILRPQQLYTHQGRTYLAGTVIMLLGIAVCARAGMLRDGTHKFGESESGPRRSFLVGFVVCCLSGLFSSALNFSYAFGSQAVDRARTLGASHLWSTGVVTALAVSGGFIVNLAYCGYLLRKNGTAGRFIGDGAGIGWFCGTLMGFLWFGGQSLYAVGITRMGELGVVIGWPLLMGMIILTSNAAGVLTGEWNDVSNATKRFLAFGMLIILAALGVLAMAQRVA